MNVHICIRCDGSGHVTGGYGWEIPWTRWATDSSAATEEHGILKAHVCPDCAGTGALLEFARTHVLPLPWGRLRGQHESYADHVDLVMQSQARRQQTH